ncbi:MAG TPA: hypothetical protein VMB77_06320 [Syntrophales bacterium]|nr:hypothetical protein [Syntrophales bacterium]
MKKTSPWFILLFPIAIPAMIVLDFFGYRIIALIILIVLFLSLAYYLYSVIKKFRSLRTHFLSLAEAFCHPGSWSVRHYPYHHTLSGSAGGHRFHYSLLGHDERAMFQLFLECPVAKAFVLEVGEQPSKQAMDLPEAFRPIFHLPGFRSLKVIPQKVPLFSRLLGGLVGSGGPGLVLRTQGDEPFSPQALKRDLRLLLDLAETLDSEPPQQKEGI